MSTFGLRALGGSEWLKGTRMKNKRNGGENKRTE